jgi:hypothetical protein
VKRWWQTHLKALWSAADWAEARRLGVVPPPADLEPTDRLLAEQAGPKVSWGPPPSQADARRREVDRLLEKKGLRPRRW